MKESITILTIKIDLDLGIFNFKHLDRTTIIDNIG